MFLKKLRVGGKGNSNSAVFSVYFLLILLKPRMKNSIQFQTADFG
jgi:hypothetical protein